MNKELLLGFFIFVALTVFLSFLFILGDFSVGKYYTFDILFTDVSGLPGKAPIQMSGVKIGVVDSITLYNGEAKVTAKIKSGVKIPKESVFSVMATGVVGSKYLDVRPNISQKLAGNNVEYIQQSDTLRGATVHTMNDVMKQLTKIIDEFTGHGDFKQSPIFKTINNLEQITDKINKGLGRDEQDFREIVVNVRDASLSIKNISADIEKLVKDNKGKISDDIDKLGTIMDNAKDISEKLNVASDKINTILDNVKDGDGTISSLINDKEMAQNIKETVDSVKKASDDLQSFTKRIRKIDVSWDANFKYNTRDSQLRNDLGIVLAPREDKRYIISVNNIGMDKPTKYDEGDQKYNTITALIEKDFNKFTLHAGAIKSSGGIGAQYRPLNNKKLGFNVDMYRFDRETDGHKKSPWMDTSLSYQINRWTNFSVGAEDVLERPGLTTGVNVRIKDEDISYIFGLVGLASVA